MRAVAISSGVKEVTGQNSFLAGFPCRGDSTISGFHGPLLGRDYVDSIGDGPELLYHVQKF